MKKLLFMLILIVIASAQTKKPVVESPEHKAAVKALEVWDSPESRAEGLNIEIKTETTLVNLSRRIDQIKDQHDYTVNYVKQHPDADDRESLMADAERLSDQYKDAVAEMKSLKEKLEAYKTEREQNVTLLKQRVEHVDGCVKVFQVTIDMKPSDLTIRQTEQVKECRSLDLYPPQK